MQSLNSQLLAFKSSVLDRADAETVRALRQAEVDARCDAAEAHPLAAGDVAPDFTLRDADGKICTLSAMLKHGPVILIFFKGGWCPYSMLTLRAWEDVAADIRATGGQIIALSPQKAARAEQARAHNGVSFPVLADSHNRVAEAFGILGECRPIIRKLLRRIGCDLTEENEDGGWTLPRAAEFLIGTDGIIRIAHVSAVHFERMEPKDGLAAMQALVAEPAEA